jgi:hypothetical protein
MTSLVGKFDRLFPEVTNMYVPPPVDAGSSRKLPFRVTRIRL